jgi:hypothetical protein
MGSRGLATGLTLLALALVGCGDNAATPAARSEPFELEGKWLYLGPSDGPHTLEVTRSAMVYADVDGKWSSNWTLKAYDNDLRHFQVAFVSGTGTYLPVGQSMAGAYEVSGTLLTAQLASGAAYPVLESPGTCTAAADGVPVPECRLYIEE